MDILSEVLRAVRLDGALFFDSEMTAPWVAEGPPVADFAQRVMPGSERVICFHAVFAGACWAGMDDNSMPPLRLEAGDVLVVPAGTGHSLASAPGMRGVRDLSLYCRPNDRPLPFVLRGGGGGAETTRFVCGYLGCDTKPFNPLLDALPPVIHARGRAGGAAWITRLIELAVQETGTRRAGGEIVLARLSELLFVEVIRGYLDSLPEESRGWRARSGSRARCSPSASPSSWAWRRSSISAGGGCSLPRGCWSSRGSRSRRWRARSATSPRRRSTAPSRR